MDWVHRPNQTSVTNSGRFLLERQEPMITKISAAACALSVLVAMPMAMADEHLPANVQAKFERIYNRGYSPNYTPEQKAREFSELFMADGIFKGAVGIPVLNGRDQIKAGWELFFLKGRDPATGDPRVRIDFTPARNWIGECPVMSKDDKPEQAMMTGKLAMRGVEAALETKPMAEHDYIVSFAYDEAAQKCFIDKMCVGISDPAACP